MRFEGTKQMPTTQMSLWENDNNLTLAQILQRTVSAYRLVATFSRHDIGNHPMETSSFRWTLSVSWGVDFRQRLYIP